MKNIFKNKIFNKSKSKRRAFTVAEALSVLVLLGVIAAIMIPTMALKYRESVRRTQLKSALATYKQVIGQMVGEHKFTSTAALDEWAAGPFDGDGNATCGNARAYFHIVEEYSVNRQTYPCIFKTPDGMWWYIYSQDRGFDLVNIGDGAGDKKASMSRAIVSFEVETAFERGKGDNWHTTNAIRERLYQKAARDDWKETFYFVTLFDKNGAPRIMDFQYGRSVSSWLQIRAYAKVAGFYDPKVSYNDFLPIDDKCASTRKHCCVPQHDDGHTMLCYAEKGPAIQMGEPGYCLGEQSKFYNNDGFSLCSTRQALTDIGGRYDCDDYKKDDAGNTIKDADGANVLDSTACAQKNADFVNDLLCSDELTGICKAKTDMDEKLKEMFCTDPNKACNVNIGDFNVGYSSKCANSMADGCTNGTVGFSLTEACKKDPACLGKYVPDNDTLTLAGVSSGELETLNYEWYDCYQSLHAVDGGQSGCSGAHNDGYLWQSGLNRWSFNDGTTVTKRPDGNTYVKKPDETYTRKCGAGAESLSSCSCCSTKYSGGKNCQNVSCSTGERCTEPNCDK